MIWSPWCVFPILLPNLVVYQHYDTFLAQQKVSSPSEVLRKRVEAVFDMALTTISSLAESFISGDAATTMAEVMQLSKDKSVPNIVTNPTGGGDGNGKDGGGDSLMKVAHVELEIGQSEKYIDVAI